MGLKYKDVEQIVSDVLALAQSGDVEAMILLMEGIIGTPTQEPGVFIPCPDVVDLITRMEKLVDARSISEL